MNQKQIDRLKKLEVFEAEQSQITQQIQNELKEMIERNLGGEVLDVGMRAILFSCRGKKYLLRLEE